jgi:hypothetical protein
MKTRLETLHRLRALYGVVAHMHGVVLEQAAAAVRDAEERIDGRHAMARRASAAGLAALGEGDTPEWRMQESQRGFSEQDAEWLAGLRERRKAAVRSAAELYRANRMQLEQMQSLIQGLRETLDRERTRREQMESDDRFLSRQRWRERRDAELKGRS